MLYPRVPDARLMDATFQRRSCSVKRRHHTKREAVRERKAMRADGLDLRRMLQVYWCLYCDGWHLGKRRSGGLGYGDE